MRRIKIFDTTLRDGEQSPGIALPPSEKARIALTLERLGVDVVEAGFAAASPGDFEGVAAVASAVNAVTVASLARTTAEDIDAAAAALAPARRASHPRLHRDERAAHGAQARPDARRGARAASLVGRLRGAARDEVEFSAEDATRSDRAFLAEVCRAAVAAGATIVNLPDTVGYTSPGRVRRALRRDGRALSRAGRCRALGPLSQRPRAGGRELARRRRSGCDQVECTVNGIGERAGNASLEEFAMALRVRADVFDAETGIDPGVIREASALVRELTGYPVGPNKPIVGANAFAHEAGIHQDGMLKDAGTYQIIDPRELGTAMTLPLGKHSGRHAFALACAEAGHTLERDQLDDRLPAVQGARRPRRARFPRRGVPGGSRMTRQDRCLSRRRRRRARADGRGDARARQRHPAARVRAGRRPSPVRGRGASPAPAIRCRAETRAGYRRADAILVASPDEPAFDGVKADLRSPGGSRAST